MFVLGLGSNLGNRLENLRNVYKLLRRDAEFKIEICGPIYESEAELHANNPVEWNLPYLNTVIKIRCSFTPQELLKKIKIIEELMGRPKIHPKNSPRVIDIDILWSDFMVTSEKLTIPHKKLCKRVFALLPLIDLIPEWEKNLSQLDVRKAKENLQRWQSSSIPYLNIKKIKHRIDIPQLMGIVNITPDSFSDGGIKSVEEYLSQIYSLYDAGAEIIDLGAESTRPGAQKISTNLEWLRLAPVLKTLIEERRGKIHHQFKISIDTKNPQTAEKAISIGVDILNDVSGFSSDRMRKLVLESKLKVIFMHNLGVPVERHITIDPRHNPVQIIYEWAIKKKKSLLAQGFSAEQLIFDPGIGFGKTAKQSLTILSKVSKFKNIGLPLLVGPSRKSFLDLFTEKDYRDRDFETAIVCNYLATQEIDYLRIHNVEQCCKALTINQYLSNN